MWYNHKDSTYEIYFRDSELLKYMAIFEEIKQKLRVYCNTVTNFTSGNCLNILPRYSALEIPIRVVNFHVRGHKSIGVDLEKL